MTLADESSYEAKRELVDGILRDLTKEESLKILADGIARSSVPGKALNEAVVAKILLNAHIYEGYKDITELANATEIRGLGKRRFKALENHRVSPNEQGSITSSTRSPVPRVVVDKANSVPKLFTKASYVAGGSYVNNRDGTFSAVLKKRLEEKAVVYDAVLARNTRKDTSAANLVKDMLRKELSSRSYDGVEKTCALLPINMSLPKALVAKPVETQMGLMRAFGRMVMENIGKPAKEGLPVVGLEDLPVDKTFRERFLSDSNVDVKDVERYWARYHPGLWDDMFNCYAFSLVGRDVDHTTHVLDQMKRALVADAPEEASKYCGILSGTNIFAVTSPNKEQSPRVWVIGTYKGEDAVEMLGPAVDYCSNHRNRYFGKSAAKQMLHTVNLTVMSLCVIGSIPGMERFSSTLGMYRMW